MALKRPSRQQSEGGAKPSTSDVRWPWACIDEADGEPLTARLAGSKPLQSLLSLYSEGPRLGSVTAPSDADETRAAYLAITPVAKRGSGSRQSARRASSSSSGRSTLRVLLLDVEGDGVAVRQGRYGAAVGGFGGDVAGHQAACGAGEAAVREEGDGLAQALADEGRGDAEHLAHAGSALGAFVADDDHVVFGDASGLHGAHGVFFGVEDAGRARVQEAGVAGDLDHAALGSEVALEDHQPPR